ncbi:MAG: hypothetical protein HAW66_09830 [Shewanella sp.]|nr:hypothetical protein [Shewanella sp.]
MASIYPTVNSSKTYIEDDYIIVNSSNDEHEVLTKLTLWIDASRHKNVETLLNAVFSNSNSPSVQLTSFEDLLKLIPQHYKDLLYIEITAESKCTLNFKLDDLLYSVQLSQKDSAKALESNVMRHVDQKSTEYLQFMLESDIDRESISFTDSSESIYYVVGDNISRQQKLAKSQEFLNGFSGIKFAYYCGSQNIIGEMFEINSDLTAPLNIKVTESHDYKYLTPSLLKVSVEFSNEANESKYEQCPDTEFDFTDSQWKAEFLIQNDTFYCIDIDVSVTPNAVIIEEPKEHRPLEQNLSDSCSTKS